jgi:hypothetical protein
MAGPRETLIQTRVPQDVAGWVAEMAYETGETAAGWVRRLVMRDYRQGTVPAVIRHVDNCNPPEVLAHFSPTHNLLPIAHITPLDREFLLVDLSGEPLTRHQLMLQAWFREPGEHRFVLECSPQPWRIVTLVGSAITLHVDIEWKPPATPPRSTGRSR